uniref:Uncharacterized protein n=1 Tax=Opuntia streptacantha TaxID=393608 RepID=A0A7C9EBD5_OPUST
MVKREDLVVLNVFNIWATTVLPCSRSCFMPEITSSVPLDSSSISTLIFSTIALTPVSRFSSPAATVSKYSLKSMIISSSSLILSGVVMVKIFCFSREIVCKKIIVS